MSAWCGRVCRAAHPGFAAAGCQRGWRSARRPALPGTRSPAPRALVQPQRPLLPAHCPLLSREALQVNIGCPGHKLQMAQGPLLCGKPSRSASAAHHKICNQRIALRCAMDPCCQHRPPLHEVLPAHCFWPASAAHSTQADATCMTHAQMQPLKPVLAAPCFEHSSWGSLQTTQVLHNSIAPPRATTWDLSLAMITKNA